MYTVEEFDKYKSKVMNYIMYKKRTKQEVINKFESSIPEDILDDIITYTEEAGYLNDTEYIKKAVREYICLKNLSIKEISYKLMSKGIDKNIIEDYILDNKEELEEYELNSARNIKNKKAFTLTEDEICEYLRKKGYKQDIIKRMLEEE